jgi:trehalose-phosphatase
VHLHTSSQVVRKTLERQKNQPDGTKPQKIRVNCLSSDYDGTISPIDVSRTESRVPLQTRVMFHQISSFLPISIITMKDLSFIMPRTPFAQAWSALGGLEMRIGKRVLKRESLEPRLTNISFAINYAKSHITSVGVEIEEKQDSEGHTVAFCVDWRRAKDPKKAKQEAEGVATFCKALNLKLISYEMQPFYDVYPVSPDKGWALQEMLNELAVKNGVLYMGDSETDNSAFRASSVSLGVIHDETPLHTLDCDYLVKFEYVPDFLNALLANNLLFSSDFKMIKINPNRGEK